MRISKGMTDRQKRFILEFVGRANGNATAAARLAGFKDAHNEAWRLKKRPDVAAVIAGILSERAMESVEVLARLADQARGAGAYIRSEGGTVTVDVESLLRDGLGHLIKQTRKTKFGTEVEFYDSQAALVQIGRHHKLFTDRVEQDDPDLNTKIERELAKLAAGGEGTNA
jgi:hypothetical protein